MLTAFALCYIRLMLPKSHVQATHLSAWLFACSFIPFCQQTSKPRNGHARSSVHGETHSNQTSWQKRLARNERTTITAAHDDAIVRRHATYAIWYVWLWWLLSHGFSHAPKSSNSSASRWGAFVCVVVVIACGLRRVMIE